MRNQPGQLCLAELKREARALGRLVMGPDCGTAIIGGVPLAFANVVPRAQIRSTLTYRFHPRFQAGVEWNPRTQRGGNRFGPLANLLILPETLRRPALIAGTSSDRIGTPRGQSFYLTASNVLDDGFRR